MIVGLWLSLVGCATKSISGTVATTGQIPLSNVECSFLEQKSVTNDLGHFEFIDLSLSKGEYPLLCTRKGFVFVETTLQVEGRQYIIPTLEMLPLSVDIPYLDINMDPESPLQ